MRPSTTSIERLQQLRARPAPGVPLGDAVQRELDLLKRMERDLRGMGAVWALVSEVGLAAEGGQSGGQRAVLPLPKSMRERARAIRFARGELVVGVPDQSTKFAIDRWLRSGAGRAISIAEGSRISRVKVVISRGG